MSAKILIVDDEPSARQTLENQLFPEGYTLQFAGNGFDGLTQARAWQPDVIISDVMMPNMDGFEFCRQLRTDADLGQVPVILITALNDRQAKLDGLQAGADDFISKPIDTLELRARLRTLTKLDRFRKLNEERLKLEDAHNALLQTHEALLTSETRFRNLIETSPDAIFLVDQDTGRFILSNPAAAQMYGYTQEELLQMCSTDISAEPSKTSAAIHGSVAVVPERLHRRKDGVTFPVEITGSYFNEHGKKYHTAFIRNITERKQAENQLRESEERFRSFIEQSADGFMLTDEQGAIIEWNSALTQITGLRREQVLGTAMWDLLFQMLPAEKHSILSPGHFKSTTMILLQNGQSPLFGRPVDNEIQTPSGERKFTQQISFPVRTAQGYRMGAVVRDITELKAIEQKLRENEEKYHSIVSHAVEAIALIDELGVIIEWNESAEKLTGVPVSVALGQYAWDVQARLVPPEHRISNNVERIARKVKDVLLTGQGAMLDNFPVQITHPNGKLYFLNQAAFSIPTAHGFRICIITHDVTAAKEAEMALQAAHDELEQKVCERTAELQAANQSLEKALRARDEFLAAVSHELRTPLTAVLGLAQSLQMPYYGPLTERQLKAVSTIDENGARLLNMVNDVLDFTRLQSGSLQVDLQPCYLGDICKTALKKVTPMIEKKHQHARLVITPEQIILQSDERQLIKLISHLLANASKFTPEKGELGIEVTGDQKTGQVKLIIWDKGIGIREADLPRLFQPFVQLDASLARRYEGAGLGLALISKLTQLLGGSIDVASVFGEGSRFTITLPWEAW